MARYKERKAYQRKLNKILSTVNKSIREDDLWKGRFEVRQMYSDWCEYSDGGGYLFTVLRWRDKKTGYYHDYTYNYITSYGPNQNRIFWMANEFITKEAAVWENDAERPTVKNAVDYTHTYIDNKTFHEGEDNFYMSFKYQQDIIQE